MGERFLPRIRATEVMTDVPKIVHQRLRAGKPGSPDAGLVHPEADLLAAFAEQSVSATERESVLQHLAQCGDCREVVFLALPAEDLASTPRESEVDAEVGARVLLPKRGLWLGWANLRWAALAAGIAVAVLVVRPALEHRTPTALTPVASQAPAPAASPAQAQSSAELTIARNNEGGQKPELSLNKAVSAKRDSALKPVPAAPASAAATMVASNLMKDSDVKEEQTASSSQDALAVNAPTRTVSAGGALSAGATRGEVQSDDGKLMARADAPAIEKAKPAFEDKSSVTLQKTTVAGAQESPAGARAETRSYSTLASTLPSKKQAAAWAINEGVLQRSLDGGQSWQTSIRADRSLLCYAPRGHEVWAGGQSGTLLRSTDDGVTWEVMAASYKGEPLRSDVISIETRGADEVLVTTANHETWDSTDDGKTWAKK